MEFEYANYTYYETKDLEEVVRAVAEELSSRDQLKKFNEPLTVVFRYGGYPHVVLAYGKATSIATVLLPRKGKLAPSPLEQLALADGVPQEFIERLVRVIISVIGDSHGYRFYADKTDAVRDVMSLGKQVRVNSRAKDADEARAITYRAKAKEGCRSRKERLAKKRNQLAIAKERVKNLEKEIADLEWRSDYRTERPGFNSQWAF